MKTQSTMPTLSLTRSQATPSWALWQRHLIHIMNQAGPAFVERYTRPDGTLIWREDWPGMDGSDDAYESFYTFPLFYALGGSEEIHRLARTQWDTITWQFTEYGQIYREFDAYYDWMHHGESYLYLYFLGLTNPYVLKDRQRAVRFAGFYIGEDEEAQNYDPSLKLIRSPINGSRGPRLEMTAEDWSTHRDVLTHFPAIFEDVPGAEGQDRIDWNDDELFPKILALMNERMARGDVPLNLAATSLVTHAYLYTGETKYRDWVLEYLDAWVERTEANGGITPDNIGLSGEIGENMDGKWWGGYYGWRWPHGGMMLLEALVVAGQNAALLTGEMRHLDLARSQLDLLWSLRREEEGQWVVPHKHQDAGWTDYKPLSPALPIQLWNLSQAEEDLERILRLSDHERWDRQFTLRGNGWAPGASWFRYLQGHLPDYPEQVLRASCQDVNRALEAIRNDDADPQDVYIQHWIPLNPVICEALAQLTMGATHPVYHGGLLHARVRYFDPQQERPGLPENVAALVESVDAEGFQLRLVNLDLQHTRDVILLAGAFGEHEFVEARIENAEAPNEVNSKWLRVSLGPGANDALHLMTKRFTNKPEYQHPWVSRPDTTPIQLRTPDIDPGTLRIISWG